MGARTFVLDVKSVQEWPERVPDVPGIYAIFLKDSERLLQRWGFFELEQLEPIRLMEATLFYIGSSNNLRRRLKSHFGRNSKGSSFRMTLGLLLTDELSLRVRITEDRPYFGFDDEARLANWIGEYAIVMVRPCASHTALEARLVRRLPLPLNIAERRRQPLARHLLALRFRANGGAYRRDRRRHRRH
jgi:hypothetical protein